MPRSNCGMPAVAIAALALPLAACGEVPGDQTIEIEDGYDETIDNLETVSREADEKAASEMSNSLNN
ncbi:hypothetical protein [Sphingomicrobium lutaoense]|uniref:Secreted protein n=1 Tax=Sphingomicrobium lutaoense TaxID=515949 RepID=A0A839YV94_9SPHN|nr:hypothetical protein [Sphingomicrobium lutaoense]MBB3764131.1 hypothetical protein [Sphingomicrobium lutaoense]